MSCPCSDRLARIRQIHIRTAPLLNCAHSKPIHERFSVLAAAETEKRKDPHRLLIGSVNWFRRTKCPCNPMTEKSASQRNAFRRLITAVADDFQIRNNQDASLGGIAFHRGLQIFFHTVVGLI